METSNRDEIKGMLLDRWVEDLRQGRVPQVSPEMQLLSQEEIAEVMQLARWYGHLTHPVRLPRVDTDSLAANLRQRVLQDRLSEEKAAAQLAEEVTSFGELLHSARTWRNVNLREFEKALVIPQGTCLKLESGSLPPHRLPRQKMLLLLRSLRLLSARVVELISMASTEWAMTAYARPQTQLGRLDAQLADEERQRLLAEQDGENAQLLASELRQIEAYCQALAAEL